MIGRTLSHFRFTAKLGEGGMGEVYRAEDSKLGREVAIKVLPEAVSAEPQRLARFDREARVLASLNHPSIAAIYSFEHQDPVHFLVMELAEGEDLAERIARGPVALGEALPIALQIAEALETAHERGIVHRDLKPANVRVTAEGQVKVLDFGLARAFESGDGPGAGPERLSISPTLTAQMTRVGALLGTAAYMSPEQARGQEADKRADIWSFGVVLYEMLAGKPLFDGASVADVLAAVVRDDLDLPELPEDVPPSIRDLLARCLDRDPKNRLRDIGEARVRIARAMAAPEEAEATTTRLAAIPIWRRGLPWAVAALAVAASLTAAQLYLSRPDAEASGSPGENPLAGARFTKVTDFEGSEYDAAISPDGRIVAFVSDRDGAFEVYVGQIGGGEFRKLARLDDGFTLQDARVPVRSVGFNSDGSEIWLGGGPWNRVRTTPLMGGPVRNFLGENAVNVAWSPDGERIAYHERLAGDPLYVADRNGANSRLVLGPPAGTHQHYPAWSADGQWIYLARGRPTTLEMDLWRVRPDGQGLEQLTRHKLDVRYPTPVDERTVLYSAREADGAGPWLWAVDVETGVSRRASVGLEQYASVAASSDRTRFVATVQNPQARLLSVPILDRMATESEVEPVDDLPPQRALAPRFGGASLFYLSSRGSGDGLWRFREGRVAEIWKGSETALLEPAAVSPEGTSVAVLLRLAEGWRLHLLSADGAQLRLLSKSVDARGAAAWSPDGRWIVTGGYEAGVEGLFKIPVDGGVAERIAEGEALNPVWSPNGDLIVYAGAQVNVAAPLVAVRPDGRPVELPKIEVFRFGERVRFLPDGSGLIFMRGLGFSQDFWLLDLATMKSRRLTELDPSATMRTFDITPDGQRIVFDRLSEESDIVLIELASPR